MKATTFAAQKIPWPSTQIFRGLDVVSMENVIITAPTVCQRTHKQNFSCGSLSVESTIQNKSMASCPVIMKCFYAGCGIWINLSPVTLNWEPLLLPFPVHSLAQRVHLAWPSWGMWINHKHKQMNSFKDSHAILPMDTVSLAWSFSSSFTLNVNTSNRKSKTFTFYFNERVNIGP